MGEEQVKGDDYTHIYTHTYTHTYITIEFKPCFSLKPGEES